MPSKIVEWALLLGAIPSPFIATWLMYKCAGPVDLKVVCCFMCLPLIMVFAAGEIYFARRDYNRKKHY